ncbi:hypothetical protein GCM10010245_86540 [Streptomyces spectabilis]|nr:hypothetical protein GCM10010245_86540 [Streptomyces spectabilis]
MPGMLEQIAALGRACGLSRVPQVKHRRSLVLPLGSVCLRELATGGSGNG